ncbi:MAG: type II toxin-antitoxin system VapC family toxin [Trueperaceae bacterium]|nr:MAG: type II toxin-antitoxin system VapC family toxin [Trueperaceae bacterium]
MYLLDTNVVSELRKAGTGRADPAVVRWAASVDPAVLHLSVVSVMEIEIGILRVARRDGAQSDALRRWLEGQVFAAFAGRILSVDVPVAMRCAQMLVPDPKADRDALIAATAHVHGLIVVTRNTADFRAMGAPLLDPWSTQ